MFGARLGTASRRSQSSMNSASVGSSGSSSGSVSRARHASTNSRTPGQPPASLASSKSRSQRRAVSMRLNVSRPGAQLAVELGLPTEADDVRGAGLTAVSEGGVQRGHISGDADGREVTYLLRSPDRGGSRRLRGRPATSAEAHSCARARPTGSRAAWSFGPAGCPRTGVARPGGAARGASGDGFSATRGVLAQRMSSDRQTMTRPPATRCTTASCPAEYARRSVLIDGQAFERSAAASPRRAARA